MGYVLYVEAVWRTTHSSRIHSREWNAWHLTSTTHTAQNSVPSLRILTYNITMLLTTILLHLLCLTPITAHSTTSQPFSPDTIPASTRAHWIQRANSALSELYSPCPFMAFATAIVNHSDTSTSPHGSLICLGVNDVLLSGNPTLHGEVAAINNCSEILKAQEGWKGEDVSKAWRELSLYTNGEPCPMVCTSFVSILGFAQVCVM